MMLSTSHDLFHVTFHFSFQFSCYFSLFIMLSFFMLLSTLHVIFHVTFHSSCCSSPHTRVTSLCLEAARLLKRINALEGPRIPRGCTQRGLSSSRVSGGGADAVCLNIARQNILDRFFPLEILIL